ncbi:MAG: PEP-CTERM sorting domain-containing protein [Planctomycetaceae bacterium]|nr:PEP-CTERM sorting domain-containing protein [Planctomycetaceae bacterium]
MRSLANAVAAMLFLGAGTTAQAAFITLDAINSGWHQHNGHHEEGRTNYIVGDGGSTLQFRNWFVFDLSGLTDTIIGAELRLFNPDIEGFQSNDPTETYTLFEVLASSAALDAGRSLGDPTGMAIFADLGDGLSYGSKIVSAADNNTIVSITLNANALASLNAASGHWIVGGSLTTLGNAQSEWMFGATGDAGITRQLVLQTDAQNPVPEPSSMILFAVGGLTGIGYRIRRRGNWV